MVSPLEAADITRGRAKMEIMGILGIATIACASYLVICTSRQYAATLPQGQVYKAVDIDLREVREHVQSMRACMWLLLALTSF
jgi:hypothetical protein